MLLQANGGRLSTLLKLKLKHQSFGDNEEENPEDGQQVISISEQEPRTFKHAMQGSQSDRWRDAALLENGTWEIVDLLEIQKAIGSGWVFKVKHNQDGSIEQFKAHCKGLFSTPWTGLQ